VVLRKWKASSEEHRSDKIEKKRATLKDSVANLEEEIFSKGQHIKEIETDREILKSENETLEARIKELSELNIKYLDRALEAEARNKELKSELDFKQKCSDDNVKVLGTLRKANRQLQDQIDEQRKLLSEVWPHLPAKVQERLKQEQQQETKATMVR
jgi:septal ring factor EnvC (AmiA/AmiB activator)